MNVLEFLERKVDAAGLLSLVHGLENCIVLMKKKIGVKGEFLSVIFLRANHEYVQFGQIKNEKKKVFCPKKISQIFFFRKTF